MTVVQRVILVIVPVAVLLALPGRTTGQSVERTKPASRKAAKANSVTVDVRTLKRQENLFLLYNLADMYRKFWPEVRDAQPGPWDGWRVSIAMARRKLVIDQLLLHMSKQGTDKAVVRMYGAFGDLIDETKGAYDRIDADAVGHADAIARREVARFWTSAFVGGFEAYLDRGESGERAVYEGLIQGSRTSLNARGKAQQDLNAIQESLIAKRTAVRQEQDERKAKLVEIAENEVRQLIVQHGWDTAEARFSFKAVSSSRIEPAPRDPFPVLELARLPLDRDEADPVSAYVERAKRCLKAVTLVPPGKEFNYFRAEFLSDAGRLANLASFKATGRAGFVAVKSGSLESARLGVRAWDDYQKYEELSIDANYIIRHQFIIAYAYGGRAQEAFNRYIVPAIYQPAPRSFPVLGRASSSSAPTAPHNPSFWYNAARVCGLLGKKDEGFYCLEEALMLGFKGLEEAVVSPDLASLRKYDPDYFTTLLGANDTGARTSWKYHQKKQRSEARRSSPFGQPRIRRP